MGCTVWNKLIIVFCPTLPISSQPAGGQLKNAKLKDFETFDVRIGLWLASTVVVSSDVKDIYLFISFSYHIGYNISNRDFWYDIISLEFQDIDILLLYYIKILDMILYLYLVRDMGYDIISKFLRYLTSLWNWSKISTCFWSVSHIAAIKKSV